MPASTLINSGSSGCIFKPIIPCEKEITPRHVNTTKLIAKDTGDYNEYEMNSYIKELPHSEEWTNVWEMKCKSPKYKDLRKTSDIDKCLKPKRKKIGHVKPDKRFVLLQGTYGGHTVEPYMDKVFPESIFRNNIQFIKKFKQFFEMFKWLFFGLVQLNEHGICHSDINPRNITVTKDRFLLVDYGLSVFVDKPNKQVVKRMKKEFNGDRLYECYPYEYLYFPNHPMKTIIEEQEDIATSFFRINHEDIYEPIHTQIFQRHHDDEMRFEQLEDKIMTKKHNNDQLKPLLQALDSYSLAMMPITMILDHGDRLSIPTETIIQLLRSKLLKGHMDLLKNMSEHSYKDRISPQEAHERYENLIK